MSDAHRTLRERIRANTPHALRTYLRRLAEASVLAGAVSGCASSHFPPETEVMVPTCVDSVWQAGAGLTVTGTHDYLGVYAAGGMLPEAYVLHSTGTSCGGASDAAACQAAVTMIQTEGGFGRFVLTTTGDDVVVHSTEEELMALLGTIDTPNEALLRAWHAGYAVRCDEPSWAAVREVLGGYEVIATQVSGGCGAPLVTTRYLLMVDAAGSVTVLDAEEIERVDEFACAGRRPEGLVSVDECSDAGAVGRWLASIGRLEASAVHAFESLALELESHGAPAPLVERARAAAQDEVRHAELISAQAARFGATPYACEVVDTPVRSLFAIALENAVEGCVRETYGAVVAHHQSLAASDRELARTMGSIAEDESRHAELSWAVAAWIEPRLSAAERAQVVFARAAAVGELRAEMGLATDPALQALVGLPAAPVAVALLDDLSATLL